MNLRIQKYNGYGEQAWYIGVFEDSIFNDSRICNGYLWKNGTIQDRIGLSDKKILCDAPGYWPTREAAQAFLDAWNDKQGQPATITILESPAPSGEATKNVMDLMQRALLYGYGDGMDGDLLSIVADYLEYHANAFRPTMRNLAEQLRTKQRLQREALIAAGLDKKGK